MTMMRRWIVVVFSRWTTPWSRENRIRRLNTDDLRCRKPEKHDESCWEEGSRKGGPSFASANVIALDQAMGRGTCGAVHKYLRSWQNHMSVEVPH